jgi:hypothetical protein
MADELDFLDDFGVSESDASQPLNVYEKFILDLANKVTADLRDTINTKARNTGGLAQSVVYFPNGQLSFEIQADNYYKFIDEGVNPVGKSLYDTPYSFQFPGVSSNHARAIQQWKGLEMSQAYAIASHMKTTSGLKPRNITTSTINDAYLERIASDLAAVTGLLFDITFTKNTKTWQ